MHVNSGTPYILRSCNTLFKEIVAILIIMNPWKLLHINLVTKLPWIETNSYRQNFFWNRPLSFLKCKPWGMLSLFIVATANSNYVTTKKNKLIEWRSKYVRDKHTKINLPLFVNLRYLNDILWVEENLNSIEN